MREELYEALLAFQGLRVAAQKDGKNPHFKSNYSTLESVINAVSYGQQFGLCFTQEIDFEVINGEVHQFVRTSLIHAPTGNYRSSRTPILTKDKTDPQKMGSGVSYAKRYGLQSIFGIPSGDDDGNAASARPEPVKSEQLSPSKAQTAPAADSSLSQAAGASPLTLAQKIANATSLQELNDLYSEYKDKIEALDAEVKAKAINAFSVKKAELKG